jgi:hypothetical protein
MLWGFAASGNQYLVSCPMRHKSNAAAYFLASISRLTYATSKPLILWD